MMATEYVFRNGRHIEVETLETGVAQKRRRRADPYIGCPLKWVKRVLPVVQSKEQLAVALWLHRRRVVCGGDRFTVPNQELRKELGVNRYAKYRALQCLERAGAIALTRDGKRTLQVQILW
jgi:hypothetical protein